MLFVNEMLEKISKTVYPQTREADFDSFWQNTISLAERHKTSLEMVEVKDSPYRHIKVYDLTLNALDGTPLKAWLYMPQEASVKSKMPGMVFLHGGGGSRNDKPVDCVNYALCGCAVLQPEFRLQNGMTASNTVMLPGNIKGKAAWATNNIHSPDPGDNYFYHAFTDQLLWVKELFKMPQINPEKIAVAGISQGGGTALIMAALVPDVALCLPVVPSYCCWEKRIFTRTACAEDIAGYIARHPEKMEQVFRVMSYFDALNHADRITCPVKMQISLRDSAAPADCAFAAYNLINSEKSVKVNCFGEHNHVDFWQILQDLKEFCD